MKYKIKTHDIIPYVFSDDGRPLREDERYTIAFMSRGVDKHGNYHGSSYGKSVFDQLSDQEFELIMERVRYLSMMNNMIEVRLR